MKPFARLMVMTLGLGLLAALTGLVGPQPQRTNAAVAAAVAVVNTPNVNVANTPTVNAQQSGAWNVGINGTPTVNLNNSPTMPLFNRDVENPARQPFQMLCGVTIGNTGFNNFGNCTLTTVPNGKELVIQTVSGLANFPTGVKPSLIQVNTDVGGNHGDYAFLASFSGTDFGRDQYEFIQPVNFYAGANTTVTGSMNITPHANDGFMFLTISGYLVDCGAGPGCPLP